MICGQCSQLTIDRLFEKTSSKPLARGWSHGFLILHSTYKELVAQARNGCEVCKVFNESFVSKFESEEALLERISAMTDEFRPSSLPVIAFLGMGMRSLPFEKKPITLLSLQIGTSPQRPGESNIMITFRISKPRGIPVRPSAKYAFRYTHLDHDLGSEENFAIAKSWLIKCSNEHDNQICPSVIANDLPSRLIDVGQGSGDGEPRLIQPSKDHKDKYLALSHCWGPSTIKERLLTTKATLRARLKAIPISSMPANFRDAVIITRKLGFRYLWIDSLCIIQDSKEDWKAESANMGNIYTKAALTIAAAAAKDSDGGLLQKYYHPQESGGIFAPSYGFMVDRKEVNRYALPDIGSKTPLTKHPQLLCHIKMYKDEDSTTNPSVILGPWLEFSDIEENFFRCTVVGPLAHRGWCLQERILSHRILYYGVRQIYWQCASRREAADGEVVPIDAATSTYSRSNDVPEWPVLLGWEMQSASVDDADPRSDSKKEEIARQLYKTWHNILNLYINRRLTYGSDRLPGLAGMASVIGKVTGDVYVAGFWRRSLLISLVWTPILTSIREHEVRSIAKGYEIPKPQWELEKRKYAGPSWSWASADFFDNLTFNTERNEKSQFRIWKQQDAEILGVEVELADKEMPYGAIMSGTLALKGLVRRKYDTRTTGWDLRSLISGIVFSCCPHSPWNRPQAGRTGRQHALWDYPPRQHLSSFNRMVLHILAWVIWTMSTMICEWRIPVSYGDRGDLIKCRFCREYLKIHILSQADYNSKMTKAGEMAHEVDLWSLILEPVAGEVDTFQRVGISSETAYLSEEDFKVWIDDDEKPEGIPEAFVGWQKKTVTII